MKRPLISIATVLLGLVSGCKDEKLKECMAKTESLEQEFEELCENGLREFRDLDSEARIEIGTDGLYTLVKKRNETWKETGCDQYQARWICRCHRNLDGIPSIHYHHAECDYGVRGR